MAIYGNRVDTRTPLEREMDAFARPQRRIPFDCIAAVVAAEYGLTEKALFARKSGWRHVAEARESLSFVACSLGELSLQGAGRPLGVDDKTVLYHVRRARERAADPTYALLRAGRCTRAFTSDVSKWSATRCNCRSTRTIGTASTPTRSRSRCPLI